MGLIATDCLRNLMLIMATLAYLSINAYSFLSVEALYNEYRLHLISRTIILVTREWDTMALDTKLSISVSTHLTNLSYSIARSPANQIHFLFFSLSFLFCVVINSSHSLHDAMTDVVIPKTASRNYELELGIYDRIVMVDGLYNPLISLQFGGVRIMQS